MSDINLDIAEQVALIEKHLRETQKFIAEQNKLEAERGKLVAEGRKFDRDLWIAMTMICITGLGVIITLLKVL
jgi:hypothetical protein